MMKWCLVLAGVKDLSRPADKLSVSQNFGEVFWYFAGVGHAERSACSFGCHGFHLGAVLVGYHSSELQLSCGASAWLFI